MIGASGGCGSSAIHIAKALGHSNSALYQHLLLQMQPIFKGASEIVGVCSGKNEEFVKSFFFNLF